MDSVISEPNGGNKFAQSEENEWDAKAIGKLATGNYSWSLMSNSCATPGGIHRVKGRSEGILDLPHSGLGIFPVVEVERWQAGATNFAGPRATWFRVFALQMQRNR